MAPHGTGLLYVRRDSIRRIWPLMPGLDSPARRYPDILGTHQTAAQVAIVLYLVKIRPQLRRRGGLPGH
jgi:selenocysteine lyase/cysteine desulfurase